MTHSPAKKAALGYVDAINGKDLPALLALFAEGARLVHPFGEFTGDEVSEFYGNTVMEADTKLTVRHAVAEERSAVIEVSARSPLAPDQDQLAVDVFDVDADGKITELRIYYRNFDLG